MHIHPSSPNSCPSSRSEEIAATKIQAGFRGYRVRKHMNGEMAKVKNGCHFTNQTETAPSNGSQTRETNSGSNGPSERRANNSQDESIEDRSATKIQAGMRGFLVRKKQKIAAEAATKIQAGFRAFKARKEVQKLKQI